MNLGILMGSLVLLNSAMGYGKKKGQDESCGSVGSIGECDTGLFCRNKFLIFPSDNGICKQCADLDFGDCGNCYFPDYSVEQQADVPYVSPQTPSQCDACQSKEPCPRALAYGELCQKNSSCLENLACNASSNRCVCLTPEEAWFKDLWYHKEGSCEKRIPENDPCTDHPENCVRTFKCLDGVCKCSPSDWRKDDKCLARCDLQAEDYCGSHGQCVRSGKETGKCKCSDGYELERCSHEGLKLCPAGQESKIIDIQRNFEGVAIEWTVLPCRPCHKGYYSEFHEDRRPCSICRGMKTTANRGAKSEEDCIPRCAADPNLCGPHGKCGKDACVCDPGYHAVPIPELSPCKLKGSSCLHDANLCGHYGTCVEIEDTCECDEGYEQVNKVGPCRPAPKENPDDKNSDARNTNGCVVSIVSAVATVLILRF